MNTTQRWVLAIDPGSDKCGYACVCEDQTCRAKGIVYLSELYRTLKALYTSPLPEKIVVGKCGSTSITLDIIKQLEEKIPVDLVDEKNTTYEARPLFFEENPPTGFWKYVPLSFQSPDRPIDDYAAWLIGKRWWQAQK